MRDPYQILGIDRNASEEEVKRAYRKLSRLYHPDSNINNPNKAQAEEKFKEVQDAYKIIMDNLENGISGIGPFSYGESYTAEPSQAPSQDSVYYQATANFIRNRMYQEADGTLNRIKERDGRWYYFSAMVNAGLGKHGTALARIRTAIEKDPGNFEYRQFLTRLENGGEWYTKQQTTYKMPEEGFSFGFRLCMSTACCTTCCGGTVFLCSPAEFFKYYC